MISEKDKQAIAAIADKYNVKRILLFGSYAALPEENARDIDLAVEGIQAKDFFKFYGDLLFKLKKSVDLIDLSSDCKFNSLVREEGIPIYG
ncbi:MAG: hypothetical protein ABIJ41_06570 [Candidatus Omnitrophota bacterium]